MALLRASGEVAGQSVNPQAVLDPSQESGVSHGAELLAFTQAMIENDDVALAETRNALVAVMGQQALVRVVSVISNFERLVRVADGTGIPLDPIAQIFSSDLRQTLNLDQFVASANTPSTPIGIRIMQTIAQPFKWGMFRWFGRLQRWKAAEAPLTSSSKSRRERPKRD